MAEKMAGHPEGSLPEQHGQWADLKAAYRFLHNPKVQADTIQSAHRAFVRASCVSHDCVLVIQDGTELDYTQHRAATGLGFIGDGGGRGLLQHSALGVTPNGELLGVLHQRWWRRQRSPEGETRRQRQSRATEASLWADTIESIGRMEGRTRLIHVMDRGSDSFETLAAARRVGVGFLLRAKHDRYLQNTNARLWRYVSDRRVCGHRMVEVAAAKSRRSKARTPARTARLSLRFAHVVIPSPRNDPRFADAPPIDAWAVYALEEDPPKDVEPIEWMLLSSEPVTTAEAADENVARYTLRWVIEEWHKVEKTGCRLEAAQLRDGHALECLAALTAIVAVRMLQLRDMVRPKDADESLASWIKTSRGDERGKRRLRSAIPKDWFSVVAHLARCKINDLTPGVFWLTVAKQGGFIGRRSDGWPGWQTLWRGWSRIADIVQGMQIARAGQQTCG